MPSPHTRRNLTAAALAACALWGAYCTYGLGFRNGLFATIAQATAVENPYVPGGVSPLRTRYTASPVIDRQITVLVSFFSYVVDCPRTRDVDVSSLVLMAQFCAGWALIRVEGWRLGNKGSLLAWTTVLGLVMQNVTWTVTIPIYLLVQLYTSPIANPDVAPSFIAVAADPLDLLLLPFSSIIGFVVPAILMWWPGLDAYSHYGWDFTWQIFPLREYAVAVAAKFVLTRVLGMKAQGSAYLRNSRKVYTYALFLACGAQAAAVLLCLMPASLAPEVLRPYAAASSLGAVFVPWWPWRSPHVGASALINGHGLADLSRLFLQWDIQTGNTALLLWALHMHRRAVPNASTISRVKLMGTWLALGGPVAAATALLRERDYTLALRTAIKRAAAAEPVVHNNIKTQ